MELKQIKAIYRRALLEVISIANLWVYLGCDQCCFSWSLLWWFLRAPVCLLQSGIPGNLYPVVIKVCILYSWYDNWKHIWKDPKFTANLWIYFIPNNSLQCISVCFSNGNLACFGTTFVGGWWLSVVSLITCFDLRIGFCCWDTFIKLFTFHLSY